MMKMDPGTYFPDLILTLVALAIVTPIVFWLMLKILLKILRGSQMAKRKNPFPIFIFPLWLLWEVLEGGSRDEEKPSRDP